MSKLTNFKASGFATSKIKKKIFFKLRLAIEKFVATVVITTKNRKDDLRKAIDSCLKQSMAIEVMVIDDGSTDGTHQMVRSEFPSVVFFRYEKSAGYIVHRNHGASVAKGEFVFSIDDDAEFSDTDVIAKTIEDFKLASNVGAVAIPCIDVNKSPDLRQPKPNEIDAFVTSEYIGTAHAVRRDLFLEIGGYRENLIHQGEERDLAIRMLEAGHVVLLGSAGPILHYESPKRDTRRMDHFGRRNDVLFVWQNAPAALLPLHLLATTLNGMLFGLKIRRPLRMAMGLLAGYRDMFIIERKPVSAQTYRLYRDIRKNGPRQLKPVLQQLKAGKD